MLLQVARVGDDHVFVDAERDVAVHFDQEGRLLDLFHYAVNTAGRDDLVAFLKAGPELSDGELTIRLKRTHDIAAELGAHKAGRILVGFALETDHEEANAEGKLQRKNFDFIVLNSLRDAGAGFGVDTNKVTLIDRAGREELPLLSKAETAEKIADKIESILK